jgi:hypothetical protein
VNLYEGFLGSPAVDIDPLGLACPKEYQIPDDIRRVLDDAWARTTRPGGARVEQGGTIVRTREGRTRIRWAEKVTGNSTVFPEADEGETVVGTFHTHPPEPEEGTSFSEKDIGLFVSGKWGQVMYVMAGRCVMVLTVDDAEKCKKCRGGFAERYYLRQYQIERMLQKAHAEAVEEAVKATAGICGLCYHKVCKETAPARPQGQPGGGAAAPARPPKSWWERWAEAMYEFGMAGYPGLQ